MSFNVGPTLLSWLEANDRTVYDDIVAADRESRDRFSGHGSAIAQVYGHVILPLANERDRRTQVRWGIRDFERRFGRAPEGMWLAETAVDTASLEVLAQEGIRFTLLAPRQAKRVAALGKDVFTDVSDGSIDTQQAYRIDLPSGRSIDAFFYDGGLSQAVAFERLLSDGAGFAQRLLGAFRTPTTDGPRLVHIATDGETYGHHHAFGEMALAWAARSIERREDTVLTNYGAFLDVAPPRNAVEIVERSAWSCAHGVGRWSEDCGCRMRAGSSQAWRRPLREALEGLQRRIDGFFERTASGLFHDAWRARDEYIDVVLDRSPPSVERFLAREASPGIDPAARVRALELMELQRFSMLMFTSCGWFFDDVTGLETTQILEYAGRAIDLAHRLGGIDVDADFANALEHARGAPGATSAREVYEKRVAAARIDASRIAAHVAIASLVGTEAAFASRAHEVRHDEPMITGAVDDEARFATGRVAVTNRFTGNEASAAFAVVHERDLLFQGVATDPIPESKRIALHERARAGRLEDLYAELARMDGFRIQSIGDLLPDAQGRMLTALLERTVARVTHVLREVHEDCAPLLHAIAPLAVDPPAALLTASKVVMQAEISSKIGAIPPDFAGARALVAAAHDGDVHLDLPDLEHRLRTVVERIAASVERDGDARLSELDAAVDFALTLFRTIDLSRAQDLVWRRWSTSNPSNRAPALASLARKLRLELPTR